MLDQEVTLRRMMLELRAEEKRGEEAGVRSFATNAASAPRVLAVTGGKGGVGKTLTTANLGLCLARLGMRTLLMDGDFGLANLDVVLNVRAEHTLDDVLAGDKDLRDIILDGPAGVRLVPAASGLLKVPELGRVQKLMLLDQIENLDEGFDVVLIDTPAGVSRSVQYWTASAAEVIVVATPEPTAMADAYATMKVLSKTIHETQFKLIVNMARSDDEGLKVYERLATLGDEYLGIKVEYLGSVLFDEAVRNSVRERVTFVQKYPFSAAARGMRAIAAQLASERGAVAAKGNLQFFWRRMITSGQRELCG